MLDAMLNAAGVPEHLREERDAGMARGAAFVARKTDMCNGTDAIGDSWVTCAFNGMSALKWLDRPERLELRKNIVMEALVQASQQKQYVRWPYYPAIFCEEPDLERRQYLAKLINRLAEKVEESWSHSPTTAAEKYVRTHHESKYMAGLLKAPVTKIVESDFVYPTKEFAAYAATGGNHHIHFEMRLANRTALNIPSWI